MADTFGRPVGVRAVLVDVMNFQFTTRLDADLVTVLTPSGSFDFQLADDAGDEVARLTGTNILPYLTVDQLATLRELLLEIRAKVMEDSLSTYAQGILTGVVPVGVTPIQLLIGDQIYECRPAGETPTDTQGYVFSDGTVAGVVAALRKAINLIGVAGTDYAASMVKNGYVGVYSYDENTLGLRALIPGADGNLIPLRSITHPATWTFTGAHLSGGLG